MGGLERAATGGLVWQGAAHISGRLVVLAATIVLARVLTPAEFGLVTVAIVVINFLEVTADFGVSQALIYLPASRRRNDAALLCSLVSGLVLASAVIALAPVIAGLLGTPGAAALLRVLAVSLVFTSVGLVPDMLLRRDLQFRRRLMVQLAMGGTRGLVTIALAVAGLGAWSLVIGYVTGQIAYSTAAWLRVTYRPTLASARVSRTEVVGLLRYGLPVAVSGVLTTVVVNVDYVVVSRILGEQALGYYTLAFRLPEMIIISVFQVVSSVTFPIYRRAAGDPSRLRRAYLKVLRLQVAYGLIVGLGLAAVAPVLVPVLFGARWQGAVVALQALAVYAALRSLGLGVVDLLKATGKPNATLTLALARLVVLVPALVYGAQNGIEGVAVAQIAVALLFALVMQLAAARVLLTPAFMLVKACTAPMAAAFAGAAAAVAAMSVPALQSPAWLRLLVGVLAGGGAALTVLTTTSSAVRRDLRAISRVRAA